MNNQTSKEPVADTADAAEHIGQALKRAREKRKLKLPEVSKELMIRRFYLQAIEDGRFEDLPVRVYSTGFIQSYANHVGIDPGQALARFLDEAYGDKPERQTELSFPDPVESTILPDKKVIWGGAIALLFLIMVLSLIPADEQPEVAVTETGNIVIDPGTMPGETEEDPEPETIAPDYQDDTDFKARESSTEIRDQSLTDQLADQPGAEITQRSIALSDDTIAEIGEGRAQADPTEPDRVAQKPANHTANFRSRIKVKVIEPTWIEITGPDGEVILSRVLESGTIYPVPNREQLRMVTGNAGGIRLIVDDKTLPALGRRGTVLRDINLNPSALITRLPR